MQKSPPAMKNTLFPFDINISSFHTNCLSIRTILCNFAHKFRWELDLEIGFCIYIYVDRRGALKCYPR